MSAALDIRKNLEDLTHALFSERARFYCISQLPSPF